MNPEDFKTIEKIYHAAIELPESERHAFLATACAGDSELLSEIEALIEIDQTNDGFLESSPQQLVAELMPELAEPVNLVGSSIGHFRIEELLGKGGMGEVYLAEDTKLDRKVALKFLPPEFVVNADRMNRFNREAKAVTALNHPNIITIYDINEVAGRHFIANEYIDGQTLRQFADGQPIESVRALEIAIQIASALAEAHSAGIAHRDIKPDNIMIRRNGLVKILDFGIAKVSNAGESDSGRDSGGETPATSTQLGMLVGTADYMSPEQARGLEVDTRTDLFSFGIVLFELIEGRLPFSGATSAETIDAILNQETPAAGINSAEIRDVLDRCLKKDRAERYQNAEELLIDLRSARRAVDHRRSRLTTDGSEPSPANSAPQLSHENSIGKRRATAVKWIAAALLLAGIAGWIGYGNLKQERRITSIAVMPFAVDGDDKSADYLSDGMTETLMRRLSGIPGLSIKARSSVFSYQGKNVDPRQIGRELNVDALLFGRMTQLGEQLTLQLELVDSATLDIIWTESYTRQMSDLATIQVEIAGDVSKKLQFRLTEAEQKQIAKVYTSSSEAQQLYLRGRFHWNKRNVRDFKRAIGYFERAVEIDPNFALAYAGLADTLALMPLYGNYRPRDYMPRAKDAARSALELDANLAEAHASLGYILNSYDYDWKGAEREYNRAIELNPSYATARQWYAEHLAFRGLTDDALAEISKTLELDPLSLVINRMKGNILLFAKRHDEAIAQFERTVEMFPDNALVRFNIGDAYESKGMQSEAVESYLIGLQLDGIGPNELESLRVAYRTRGWDGFWEEYLVQLLEKRKAQLENNPGEYFNDESLAFAYAAAKNKEKAIEHLVRAYDERNSALVTLRETRAYDILRADPRFQEILRKVGLPLTR